jgi:hypothetical protein
LNPIVVISAENNPYCGWQCAVAATAAKRWGYDVWVFAHSPPGAVIDPPLDALRDRGVRVEFPPPAAVSAGVPYLPRHTPATLAAAAESAGPNDLLVLCDPDVLIVERVPFTPWAAAPCTYLDALEHSSRVQTPYCIPATAAAELARAWMSEIDRRTAGGDETYIRVMYAAVAAAAALGMRFEPTLPCVTNFCEQDPATPLIHYCYPAPGFNKKAYAVLYQVDEVWGVLPCGEPGTILHAITSAVATTAIDLGYRSVW